MKSATSRRDSEAEFLGPQLVVRNGADAIAQGDRPTRAAGIDRPDSHGVRRDLTSSNDRIRRRHLMACNEGVDPAERLCLRVAAAAGVSADPAQHAQSNEPKDEV